MTALPQYHSHLMLNRYTLLSRIFGLHRVQMRSGRRVFFVVMGNVFPIDRPVHERYDLKGSTRNRFTTDEERQDPNVVLKDLDWINSGRKLHLGGDKKRRLLSQIQKDCALLEKLEVRLGLGPGLGLGLRVEVRVRVRVIDPDPDPCT